MIQIGDYAINEDEVLFTENVNREFNDNGYKMIQSKTIVTFKNGTEKVLSNVMGTDISRIINEAKKNDVKG